MGSNSASTPTYSAEQFAPLFSVEDRHFWFGSRNRSIAAALRALPNFAQIHDVLEVGCGTGVVLAQLQRLFPSGRVTGMDLFEEGLRFARRRFSGLLIQGDVLEHSFEHPFDLVAAFDVIEHLDDDEKVIRRLADRIRPGGHLILTVPAHQTLWSYFDEVAHHRRRYSVSELKRKLEAAGLTGVFVTQFMTALFPLMWLRRRWVGEGAMKLSGADEKSRQAAVEADLKINPVVNALMKMALWPESFFIRRRVPLPLGSSLLAIATCPLGGRDIGSDN